MEEELLLNINLYALAGTLSVNALSININNSLKLVVNASLAEINFDALKNNSYNQAVNNIFAKKMDTAKTLLKETLRYDTFSQNSNIEDLYAQNQSTLKSWGNTAIRTGVNLVGSFSQVMGSLLSVVFALKDGNSDSMFNNLLSKAIDEYTTSLNEKFLSFQSNYDKKNLWKSMINLFDKGSSSILQGAAESLGFSLGTILGVVAEDALVTAATEGTGLALLLAAQTKMFTQYLTKIDDVADFTKGIAQVDKAIVLNLLDKYGSKVSGIARQMVASSAEAKIEALETEKHLRRELEQEYFNKKGYSLTGDDLRNIRIYSEDAARQRYIANMAILTISNQIQFLNLFKDFNFSKRFFNNFDDTILKKSGESIEDLTKLGLSDILEATTRLGKIANTTKKYGSGVLGAFTVSEGAEEGLQFAVDKIVSDYATQKMKDKNSASLLTSTMSGLKELVGTEEGWINIVSGIIGGAVSAGTFKAGDLGYKAIKGKSLFNEPNDELRAQKEKQLDLVNKAFDYKSIFGTFKNKVADANAAVEAEENSQKSLLKNNRFEFEHNKNFALLNYTMTALKNNQYEGALMQVEELGKLKNRIQYDETGIELKTLDSEINRTKAKMDIIKSIYDDVSTKFSGRKYNNQNFEYIKDELVYQHFLNLMNIKKADKLNQNISQKFGNQKVLLDKLMDTYPLLVKDNLITGYSDLFLRFNSKNSIKLISDLEKELEDEKSLLDLGLEYKEQYSKKKAFYKSYKDMIENMSKDSKILDWKRVYQSFKELTKDEKITDDELQDYFQQLFDARKYVADANRSINKYNALLTEQGQFAYIDNIEALRKKRDEDLINLIKEEVKKQKGDKALEEKVKDIVKKDSNLEELTEEDIDESEDIVSSKSLIELKELKSLTKEHEQSIINAIKNSETLSDLNDKDIDSIIDYYRLGKDWEDVYIRIIEIATNDTFNSYEDALNYAGDELTNVEKAMFIEPIVNNEKTFINLKILKVLKDKLYLELLLEKDEIQFYNNEYKNRGIDGIVSQIEKTTDFNKDEILEEFKFIFDEIAELEKEDFEVEEKDSVQELKNQNILLVNEAVKEAVEQVLLEIKTELTTKLTTQDILQLTEKGSLDNLLGKGREELILIESTLIEEEEIKPTLSLFKSQDNITEENMNLIERINSDTNKNKSLVDLALEKKKKGLYDKQKSKEDFIKSLGCKI